jgi:hypothetical protein
LLTVVDAGFREPSPAVFKAFYINAGRSQAGMSDALPASE